MPDTSQALGENTWMWADLASHLKRLWRFILAALDEHNLAFTVNTTQRDAVNDALEQWIALDPLANLGTPPS